MKRSSLSLCVRLARREVARRPWRTLLIALLVAVPVAGMTVVAVLVRSNQLSPLQEWRLSNGSADIVVRAGAGVTAPPGSRVVTYQSDRRVLRTAEGKRTFAAVSNLPVTEPMAAGIVHVTSGRAPAAAGEVLLSRSAARNLGAEVGSVLRLERPFQGEVTVVGLGEDASAHGDRLLLLSPAAPFPVRADGGAFTRHLVDLPDGVPAADLRAWNESRAAEVSPALVGADTITATAEPVAWSWVVGAVALTVAGIVIASAFAAGARRQLTTLGQLSANGAPAKVLRRTLVLQGTWTGLVGVAAGLALAAGLLARIGSYRDVIFGRHVGDYDVRVLDLVPIVVLGLAASTIAALVPARSASRVPVLAALAGRRPLGAVPRWLTVTGAGVSGCGLLLLALAMFGARGAGRGSSNTVWILTGIAGGMALFLGVCAMTPGYVSVLGPAAARLRGSWRLAARSLARQRTRTAGVVSAVCATAGLAVAASAMVHTAEAKDAQSHMRDDQVVVLTRLFTPVPVREVAPLAPPADFVAQLRQVLPGAEVVQLRSVTVPGLVPFDGPLPLEAGVSGPVQAMVADQELLDAHPLDGGVRAALNRTGVVGFGTAGERTLTIGGAELRVPVFDRRRWLGHNSPTLLVTPAKAAQLGLPVGPSDVVLRTPQPLTAEQRTEVEGAMEEWRDDHLPAKRPEANAVPFTHAAYYEPPEGPNPLVFDAILGGIALVFTLFVVAASLALAAAETRDERDVLTVVGASPRTVGRASGIKAVVLTAFGATLAVPVGLLPIVLVTRINPSDLPFVVPWRVIALLVVAVPMVAGLATTSASAVAARLRPVKISTMRFE